MSIDVHTIRDKALAYFDDMEKLLDDGKTGTRNLKVASIEGMCRAIGIKSRDFYALQGGDEDESDFYVDVIDRYHELAQRYFISGLITADTMKNLEKTIFVKADSASAQTINLVFPNWNAPDDFEDYQKIKDFCKEREITPRQLVGRLKAGIAV